ncbi:hypothetical protein BS78_K232200 [Paspalum vaginatum]|uniref:Uncharacterized protein n=1 Tax=Paspalum vaginatum TaxID=158149 RepID=A0A9W7X5P0_9POAL|nr:hypothetical protein BS78_K232200 [Paspalum vaginatum]
MLPYKSSKRRGFCVFISGYSSRVNQIPPTPRLEFRCKLSP